MKKNQSEDTSPLHQTVAGGFEFDVEGKAIAVEFTEQKLSAHAGSATFWAWLHSTRWVEALQRQLPHAPARSPNHLTAEDKALAFMHGLLGEARKLAHVAYFRRDPLVPEMLGIRRVANTATWARFFTQFDSAGANLRCFGALWRWCVAALPSRRESYTCWIWIRRGCCTRTAIRKVWSAVTRAWGSSRVCIRCSRCWRRCAWSRSCGCAGNAPYGSNAVAFLHQLRANLPRHVRLRAVRADSGFCLPELLELWESWRLPYVVVAQLSVRVQSLLRREQGWAATEIAGVEVSETTHHGLHWPRPRRLILIRQRVAERPNAGGRKLFEVPGYTFQVLVTSLPASEAPLAVWRFYNGRADCENVIKELQSGFALPSLCLQSFWATEAALCLATLTYNLCVLFQRHLGWQQKVTIHTLRFWLFITPGIISHPAGQTTIRLAGPPRERDRWRRLWQKILSPFPNCNAVANRPAFAG